MILIKMANPKASRQLFFIHQHQNLDPAELVA